MVCLNVQVESKDCHEVIIEISVHDQGIGLSKEEIEHIFDPFWRSKNIESRKLNPSGRGIGLSICKLICESLDGDIKVFSAPDYGTTFLFTMKGLMDDNIIL